jgi:HlyD family secretion protein
MTTPQPWSVRRHMTIGLLASVVLLGGTLGWGVLATISGAVVASGQIEVDQNRQVVQHVDGGTVTQILTTEGARVAAGDILLRLDGSLLRSELAIVEGQFHEILARTGRLEAERDGTDDITFPAALTEAAERAPDILEQMEGQRRLFEARRETLDKQLEQLARQAAQAGSLIEGIDIQTTAVTRQLELLASELASQQELLDKGLAQVGRVLALQREEARLTGSLGELAASRARAESSITETQIEALRLAAARREEATTQLRDIAYRELELAERRRALLERIDRLDIRAPVSGVVLGLRVTTPQAVIRPADPLMYLIPQDRPLVIAVRVPNVHIDQVFPGQPAKLMFTAFSARTTPEIMGRVSVVSADTFLDERTQIPFYRAEITPDPGELGKLGSVTLLPGMPVDAFIKTEDRSPLSYLLKPFTDYFTRAFREG